jgi:hypothetical protein
MYITVEISAHIDQMSECFSARTLLYLEAPKFSIGADFNSYVLYKEDCVIFLVIPSTLSLGKAVT